MKAIVWTDYGPPEVLKLQEVEKPAPKDNQVLVRVHAATVTAGDCEMRSLKFPLWLALPMRLYAGILRPSRIRIIGQEMAGEVEAVGKTVKRFKAGDPVFAALGFGLGGYAEYCCLAEAGGEMGGALAIKPANMSYEEAAATPVGGLEALHFLRRAHIQPGERVLINGAGGSIGTFGLQIAQYLGAEVTAVDSKGKLEMLRLLGAERVIDYTMEEFTRSGEKFDVIFDVPGKSSFSGCIKALKENGRLLLSNPGLIDLARGRWAAHGGGKRVITGTASHRAEDLDYLRSLIEAGALQAVIDRRFPLDQIVEAHRYVETGQKKGNVVISVG